MRLPSVSVLMVCALASIGHAVQRPLPKPLLTARTVVIEGSDFQNDWLDHAANEFRNQGRFELVAERETADLLVLFGQSVVVSGANAYAIPTDFGVFTIVDESKRRTFYITVFSLDTTRQVWTDSREVKIRARGAVIDLVKDVHQAIARAQ